MPQGYEDEMYAYNEALLSRQVSVPLYTLRSNHHRDLHEDCSLGYLFSTTCSPAAPTH